MDGERDYETEAKAQGWNENFEGDGKVDAKTFVEKGEKVIGIVKNHRDQLKVQVEKQGTQIQQLLNANKTYGEQQRQQRERERQESQVAISDLRAQLSEAVTNSDGPKFDQAFNAIEGHQANLNTLEPDVTSRVEYDAMASNWASKNAWYTDNPTLKDFADGVANRLQNQGVTGQYYFDEIRRLTEETFPSEFVNPNRSGANGVEEGGTRQVVDSKAQNYDNLPSWAKEACDEYEKTSICTRKEYVQNYEW